MFLDVGILAFSVVVGVNVLKALRGPEDTKAGVTLVFAFAVDSDAAWGQLPDCQHSTCASSLTHVRQGLYSPL